MSFVFPPVEAGDSVLYARAPGVTDWQAAHVVRVAHNTLDLVVMISTGETIGHTPRVNVRHVDDPWLKDPANINTMAEDGGMGVFQLRKKDIELRNKLEQLERSVETLYQSLGEEPKPRRKREPVAA